MFFSVQYILVLTQLLIFVLISRQDVISSLLGGVGGVVSTLLPTASSQDISLIPTPPTTYTDAELERNFGQGFYFDCVVFDEFYESHSKCAIFFSWSKV